MLHDRIIREKFRDNVGGKLVQLGAEELIWRARVFVLPLSDSSLTDCCDKVVHLGVCDIGSESCG